MLNRKVLDNLHSHLEQWYNDYLDIKERHNVADDQNEWYVLIEGILIAAYGDEVLEE